jgi:hypothetical protein
MQEYQAARRWAAETTERSRDRAMRVRALALMLSKTEDDIEVACRALGVDVWMLERMLTMARNFRHPYENKDGG